jgi:hypothetical protein
VGGTATEVGEPRNEDSDPGSDAASRLGADAPREERLQGVKWLLKRDSSTLATGMWQRIIRRCASPLWGRPGGRLATLHFAVRRRFGQESGRRVGPARLTRRCRARVRIPEQPDRRRTLDVSARGVGDAHDAGPNPPRRESICLNRRGNGARLRAHIRVFNIRSLDVQPALNEFSSTLSRCQSSMQKKFGSEVSA